ncbi:MAG: hypothetical protein ABMB14_28565 [Myxococcota bacterium]
MLLFATTAFAGSGPWSLSQGALTVYVGVEVQRFHLVAPVMGGEVLEADTGGPIVQTGAKLIATVGIVHGVEAELTVPYYRVEATVTAPGACTDFPNDPCATTTGLGLIEVRTKWQVLDELASSPLSVAIGPRLRLGSHTADTRDRLTNLGEGTDDLGLFAAAGRTARVGNAQLELGYWHRPVTSWSPRAPHDEWTLEFAAHLAPSPVVSFGPLVYGLWRPGGVDFDGVDFELDDRFAMLSVLNGRAGVEVVVRDAKRGVSLVGSVVRTVVVRNNPSDQWIASVGIGAYNPFRRAVAGAP